MGKFDNLLKSSQSKKKYYSNFYELYKKFYQGGPIDYAYFENLNAQDLVSHDIKRKFDIELLFLWGELEMQKYLDYEFENTINPYLFDNNSLLPIKDLTNYSHIPEDYKFQKLLEIKYIQSFSLDGVEFKNIYLAIFEILDSEDFYRPFVLLYTKNSFGKFFQIGYGYDTNNNGNVELFIDSFNYSVFLTVKGFIELPLSNKKVKLDVYDYITDSDIGNLLKKEFNG